VRDIHAVPMCLELREGPVQRLHRMQVTRRERDLGFRNDASRTRHGFLRAEGPYSAFEKHPCPGKIAKLCHRDAPKRQGWGIVPQRYSLQGPKRITGCQRAAGSGDQ